MAAHPDATPHVGLIFRDSLPAKFSIVLHSAAPWANNAAWQGPHRSPSGSPPTTSEKIRELAAACSSLHPTPESSRLALAFQTTLVSSDGSRRNQKSLLGATISTAHTGPRIPRALLRCSSPSSQPPPDRANAPFWGSNTPRLVAFSLARNTYRLPVSIFGPCSLSLLP